MESLAYIEKKHGIYRGDGVVNLDNVGRNDLAILFHELGFRLGAEIGVLLGRYSHTLCRRNPDLRLFSVDPFLAFPEYKDKTPQSQWDLNYEETKRRLSGYNCTIIRKKSMDAVVSFPDNFLDFVYIDGNHEFASETNDIHEWSKKVRPGGIIAGHDYVQYKASSFSHSYEVVNAYTQAYRIHPLFIIGRKVDHFRSWFWVKE